MRLTTGSRITIDGRQGTVVVTNQYNIPVMVKYDNSDQILEVTNQVIKPFVQK
jgi:hypothetical protein